MAGPSLPEHQEERTAMAATLINASMFLVLGVLSLLFSLIEARTIVGLLAALPAEKLNVQLALHPSPIMTALFGGISGLVIGVMLLRLSHMTFRSAIPSKRR
jgi:ABC-type lipoprotein release transport system permease subunit